MGGMGAVYRAIDQKFGSLVAIKRTFYGDAELAKAFEREARLLNGLHHPILPHVSDYFSENGENFLVMEYIEGEDLSELLKRGERFPVSTVLGWTLDLLDGLKVGGGGSGDARCCHTSSMRNPPPRVLERIWRTSGAAQQPFVQLPRRAAG